MFIFVNSDQQNECWRGSVDLQCHNRSQAAKSSYVTDNDLIVTMVMFTVVTKDIY